MNSLRETLPSQPHISHTPLPATTPQFSALFFSKNTSENLCLLSVSTSLFSHEPTPIRLSPWCIELAPHVVNNKLHIVQSKVPLNSHLIYPSIVSDSADQVFLKKIFPCLLWHIFFLRSPAALLAILLGLPPKSLLTWQI